MKKIAIINGPNLNLLGTREPEIYGNTSFEDFFTTLKKQYPEIELKYYQSNIEGELVTAIQQHGLDGYAIIINPAAYSHTSVAIADAIAAISTKVVEVHISNIFARETFRHHSFVSAKATGIISGLGLNGYSQAISFLINA
jgi:3-dehydroquinate dehydratase II